MGAAMAAAEVLLLLPLRAIPSAAPGATMRYHALPCATLAATEKPRAVSQGRRGPPPTAAALATGSQHR